MTRWKGTPVLRKRQKLPEVDEIRVSKHCNLQCGILIIRDTLRKLEEWFRGVVFRGRGDVGSISWQGMFKFLNCLSQICFGSATNAILDPFS